MASALGIGAFVLAVGVYLLAGVVKLYGRFRDRMFFSYFFYLLSWYVLIFYMLVFFISPDLLPKQSLYGYLLFSSIFLVPIHGAAAIFFADFCFRLIGKNMHRAIKALVAVPFLVIFVIYSLDVFTKLSIEEIPEHFAFSAPLSVGLMFVVMAGSIIYVAVATGLRHKKLRFSSAKKIEREITAEALRFVIYLMGGILLGLVFVINIVPKLDFIWQNNLSFAVFALVNIPGYFCVRKIAVIRARQTAGELKSADLSSFIEKHGISPRELEVVSLVISGKSNREIEAELYISAETVKKHIYNIYRKVGVKNRVQLHNSVLETAGRNSSFRKGTDPPQAP